MMDQASAIANKLAAARRELLELTGRNRLLNTQRRSARSSRIEIVDEQSSEIFRHLVRDQKSMTFVAAPAELPAETKPTDSVSGGHDAENSNGLGCNPNDANFVGTTASSSDNCNDSELAIGGEAAAPLLSVGPDAAQLPHASKQTGIVDDLDAIDIDFSASELDLDGELGQPDEDEPDARHTDDKLQTEFNSEQLQRRLLKMFYDARTFEEEQGVNVLYLALGFLKWNEPGQKERFAPLVLVPVTLSRTSARAKFRLRYDDEDIITNLSLQEKLKVDFGVDLPTIPETDDWSPDEYFEQIEDCVREIEGWEVLPNDIVLWFFSFSKFLMYRDLQPETWPAHRSLVEHSLVAALLNSGFPAQEPLCSEDEHLDALLDPLKTIHVADADSSQTLAIEEAGRGRNLVIQGPPGTGKSQTITNLIGAAVESGRTVLFVAEKMAALEVVKRRLDSLGVGDACFELHSHKASKRAAIEELDRTFRLGQPRVGDVESVVEELTSVRDKLNRHAEAICTSMKPAGITPFEAIGQLTRLRELSLEDIAFQLPGCDEWTREEYHSKRELIEQVIQLLASVGNPATNIWRGIQIRTVLPADQSQIQNTAIELAESLQCIRESANVLASLMGSISPQSIAEIGWLHRLADRAARVPDVDRSCFNRNNWNDLARIETLVAEGKRLNSAQQQLANVFGSVAWETDVVDARRTLSVHAQKNPIARFFRNIFSSEQKNALAVYQGIVNGTDENSTARRVELLDILIAGQNAKLHVQQESDFGKQVFGANWQAEQSDWQLLHSIVDWEQECRRLVEQFGSVEPAKSDGSNIPIDHFGIVSHPTSVEQIAARALELQKRIGQWGSSFEQFCQQVQMDQPAAFGEAGVEAVSLAVLQTRVDGWANQTEQLTHWINYVRRLERLNAAGLEGFAARIDAGAFPIDQVLAQFEAKYFDALMRKAFDEFPHLKEFTGTSHDALRHRFADLDRRRMELARRQVMRAHFDRMPIGAGNAGQVGLLRHELNKKRRHLALRRLLRDAGRAIQAIKPVFMMSPTSIAQFLEPGRLQFDMLVIDEASQMPPVDALGAIARCKQVVVVGDDKQLPPTSFFKRVGDDKSEIESAEFDTADMESVLSLCSAQNMPQRMLRWHYRSRHHSLIEVSNREFYDNRLCVIPSPERNHPELGLKFRYIENGVFDRGGAATNLIEARQVVDAVVDHVTRHPNQSLGVATFSVRQRDAILNELEKRRRERPEIESFFTDDTFEPFFVKNLENVQGDERDVIFISIGYAKDRNGKLSMHFGPLSNQGGERRLNVLITRARSRCEVFSSILAREIDLDRTQATGTKSLKAFLQHAEECSNVAVSTTKLSSNADDNSTDSGIVESEVEIEKNGRAKHELTSVDRQVQIGSLASQLGKRFRDHGFVVDNHVGTNGLYVDVAIQDKSEADRYVIGIECDGPDYQSARTARDRDRIRFDVLARQGWTIHRVWCVDWLNRPDEEFARLLDSANGRQTNQDPPSAKTDPPDLGGVDRVEVDASGLAFQKTYYQEAEFEIATSVMLQEAPSNEIEDAIVKVIEIEGPVHAAELIRRICQLYGQKRLTAKMSEAIEAHVKRLAAGETIDQCGDFLTTPGSQIVARDRSNNPNVRKADLIAPSEIRVGILQVVEEHFGATRDDAVVETARLFGFSSTSPQLRERIEFEIQEMLSSSRLVEMDGWLHAS